MSAKRYTEEFEIQAIKQITENDYAVSDVAKRLGVTTKSLYNWLERYGKGSSEYQKIKTDNDEVRRLKAELKRVTMERDILKEATTFFANESKKGTLYPVKLLCQVMMVERSGYYAWLKEPVSRREKEDH